jgi:hypothetical protein
VGEQEGGGSPPLRWVGPAPCCCSLLKGSLKLVLGCMKCSRNHELVYPVYLVGIRCSEGEFELMLLTIKVC